MRRVWAYVLMIVVLALVATAALFWPARLGEPTIPPCRDVRQEEPAEAEDIFFRFEVHVSAFNAKSGGRAYISTYKSEDGVILEQRLEEYRSPAVAYEELHRMIRKATRVVERLPRLNDVGQQVGERAVLFVPDRKSRSEVAVVVWSEGDDLWVLESSSLRHVQAFYAQRFAGPEKPRVQDMNVERVSGGQTTREGALEAYVACFQFEDGVVVKRTTAEYSSAEQAQAEIQRITNEAMRVLDRRPPDRQGTPWVVLRMPASRPREGQIAVVWDYGSRIVIQESSSLRHAWGLTYPLPDPRVE
jgi:hypothetical protein